MIHIHIDYLNNHLLYTYYTYIYIYQYYVGKYTSLMHSSVDIWGLGKPFPRRAAKEMCGRAKKVPGEMGCPGFDQQLPPEI